VFLKQVSRRYRLEAKITWLLNPQEAAKHGHSSPNRRQLESLSVKDDIGFVTGANTHYRPTIIFWDSEAGVSHS